MAWRSSIARSIHCGASEREKISALITLYDPKSCEQVDSLFADARPARAAHSWASRARRQEAQDDADSRRVYPAFSVARASQRSGPDSLLRLDGEPLSA